MLAAVKCLLTNIESMMITLSQIDEQRKEPRTGWRNRAQFFKISVLTEIIVKASISVLTSVGKHFPFVLADT